MPIKSPNKSVKASAKARCLQLQLPHHQYPIHIARGNLSQAFELVSVNKARKLLIVSNEVVAPLYLERLTQQRHDCHQLILADGESEKNQHNLFRILQYLLENQFHRNDYLIALGGGVIGDMAGLAAALYQRGMQLIQIPTTLLAQVDSSVGGKTAINHPLGKNMIGAFYQPHAVIIDTDTLDTLPDREFLAGLAEVAKYAILGNSRISQILKEHGQSVLARDKALLAELIELSCQTKARIVEADEKESGQRALLNLGHTFGHAIELAGQYQQYLHGEAVAIGMHMALSLSRSMGLIEEKNALAWHHLLDGLGMRKHWQPSCAVTELIDLMRLDKKNMSNRFRLVLPTNTGCEIVETEDESLLAAAIKQHTA